MLSAEELTRRGRDASNAGRHAQAHGLLRRALERADDDEQRARALQSLAHVAAERGHAHEGVGLCEQALGLRALSPHGRGLVQAQLGLLAMRTGAGEEALTRFAAAAPALADDPAELARVHLNRGDLHLQRLEADAASADFTRARDLAGDPVERAKATHNLGYAELLRGDLVAALRLMDEAATVLAPLSPVSAAVGIADRAEVLVAAGRPVAAAGRLSEVARIYGRRRLRQFQGEAELARARGLLLIDPQAARSAAVRGARLLRGRGSEDWARRADGLALQAMVRGRIRSGHWGPAWAASVREAAGRTAKDLAEGGWEGDRTDVLLHAALVEALGDPGDPGEPRDRGRPAAVTTSVPAEHEGVGTRLLRAEVAARTAWRDGDRTGAAAHVRGGLRDLHAWQSAFGSLDLQSSLVGHGRSLAELGLEQAVEDGRPEVVLEWAERARALAGRVPAVRPPSDPAAAARLSRLRALRAEPGAGRGGGGAAAAGAAGGVVPTRARHRARARLARRGRRPVGPRRAGQLPAGPRHGARPGRLARLRPGDPAGALGDVEALLPGLLADLAAGATALPRGARAPGRGEPASPALDLVGVARGASRPRLRPRRAGAAGSVGRPAVVVAARPGRPPGHGGPVGLGLGHPRAGPPLASVGLLAGPDVARAQAEIAACARVWGERAERPTGVADCAGAARTAQRVDVLHVAAHGRHAEENPLFSGIRLADGTWFGYDVDSLERVPEVVVLSACERVARRCAGPRSWSA